MTDATLHTRRPWMSRATEEANLFNPAFIATLSVRMVQDYSKKTRQPTPFALVFLIPAVVLHRRTRDALPNSTATALLPWLQENKEQLVTLAERVRIMKPAMQEGLMFALVQQALTFQEGALIVGSKRLPSSITKSPELTDEARDCLERAAFLGRWFAGAGTPGTIMSAFGIAP